MPVTLTLKAGRDDAPRRRHPWLFAGAIARRSGAGDGPVDVRAADGTLLGRGFASPRSPLAARLWALGDAPVDRALVEALLDRALALRARVVPEETDGYRVVNAEGDFLPGLVVDRYASVLVVQATTEGTELARSLWLPALEAAFPGLSILQKNDLPSRKGEGLATEDEALAGELPDGPVPFRERGLTFLADVRRGQKTGFFLDQRENRHLLRKLAPSRRVLNAFSYSGAFGVAALAGGAACVEHVDASRPALETARLNHLANRQAVDGPDARTAFTEADVFDDFRARVASGQTWDAIVTDPPAFAKRTGDVERAARGYKDVNRLALKLLAPGGTLLACSCSGPVSAELFQKILFSAALDAGVRVALVERRGAGGDHPVSLDCPETEYLKAFRLDR